MSFFLKCAQFLWRPQADLQNTGRAVYQRPVGPSRVTVNGAGGFANFRSLSPFNPASINVQKIVNASIEGTGNSINTNPELYPLNNVSVSYLNNPNTNAQI